LWKTAEIPVHRPEFFHAVRETNGSDAGIMHERPLNSPLSHDPLEGRPVRGAFGDAAECRAGAPVFDLGQALLDGARLPRIRGRIASRSSAVTAAG